jgi:hypothetical protein
MTTAQTLRIYRRSELQAIADGCLHRYRVLYIDGVDDTTDASLVGQAFHKCQHLYVEELVERKLPNDQEAAVIAFTEGVAISQLPARLIPELRQTWDSHVATFEIDLRKFVTAEEPGYSGEVSFTPDLVLADSATNTLEIVDFKSGWTNPPTEAELKKDFQARVYTRYGRDRWPNFDKYVFTLRAVRFRQETSVTFTQAELDTVDTEIRAAIATVELAKASNVWPAIPGPACRFCTLKCPVLDNPLVLEKRIPLAARESMAGWVMVAEKQLKAVKSALKDSVKEHGPIDVNGVIWDNRPSVSRSYPLSAVVAAFKTLKIPVDSATMSAHGLKSLMRQYPDLEHLLSLDERQKTSYRFGPKAAGESEEDEE